jgi:fermentation-respiration switch protein FrsA (DUF1100 family)
MDIKRVEFASGDGRCVGHLRTPADLREGEQRPIIVYCAGMSLTKEVWLPPHAERMVEAGYLTLNFDYRTFGESSGEPRCRLLPESQVEDVRAALDFVSTLPQVLPAAIGLYGASLGASVAVATAGRDPRPLCTMAVAGPMDLDRVWRAFDGFSRFSAKVDAAREEFERTGKVTRISVARLLAGDPETCELLRADEPKHPNWSLDITFESLQDLFAFCPESVVHQIAPRAVAFVCPERDDLIATTELHSAYQKAGEPKRLVTLEGARHVDIYKTEGAFEDVVQASLDWYGTHLPLRGS